MKQMLKTIFALTMILVIAVGLTTTGCKKRARQEPPHLRRRQWSSRRNR